MLFLRPIVFLLLAFWLLEIPQHARALEPETKGAERSFTVYCYDKEADLVTRELASMCNGKVVDEAFAKSVEDRRNSAIARRLRAEQEGQSRGVKLTRIGTAFYVDGQGRLLTANHVIDGCKKVTVAGLDHREYPADVLVTDSNSDLAMLAGSSTAGGIANFRGDRAPIADSFVAVVGFPDQGLPPLDPILSSGSLLRAANEADTKGNMVFRADVRPGDSGGPILDSRGSIIGIVKAKADTVRIYRETGRDIEDIALGTDLPIILEFLRRNHVSYEAKPGGEILTKQELLAAASKYVMRAECWN